MNILTEYLYLYLIGLLTIIYKLNAFKTNIYQCFFIKKATTVKL